MGKHGEPEGLGCLLSLERAGVLVSISTSQAGARTERRKPQRLQKNHISPEEEGAPQLTGCGWAEGVSWKGEAVPDTY